MFSIVKMFDFPLMLLTSLMFSVTTMFHFPSSCSLTNGLGILMEKIENDNKKWYWNEEWGLNLGTHVIE